MHIVADNSTKERVEHHRHSNKSIVSLSLHNTLFLGLSLQHTDFVVELDVSQRGVWRYCRLAYPKHGCCRWKVYHCVLLYRLQRLSISPSGSGSHLGPIGLAFCFVSIGIFHNGLQRWRKTRTLFECLANILTVHGSSVAQLCSIRIHSWS